jgi:hypothetical protein
MSTQPCTGQCPAFVSRGYGIIHCTYAASFEHTKHSFEEDTITFQSGAASSKQPRIDLIPYKALCRVADRFELGVTKHGERAWNARSDNQDVLKDREFVIARAAHAALHAMRLIAILEGTLPDDGDDDAGAIAWAGICLCGADIDLLKKVKERV